MCVPVMCPEIHTTLRDKTFILHLAGKKLDLKVAIVLVGGILLSVSLLSLLYVTRRKKNQGGETDTERKET